MIFMDIIEAWIKAAVEQVVLKIIYKSKTKGEITVREVVPDYVGYDKKGRIKALWATYDYLRGNGPRAFYPQRIQQWEATKKSFTVLNPHSRREELFSLYNKLNLKNRPFNEKVI